MPHQALALTLSTKVGRRIVLLFVISALLPVIALAVLGYTQVRRQLIARSQEQLAEAAKGVGMGVLDRLQAARTTLTEVELALRTQGPRALRPSEGLGARARSVFASLAVERAGATEVLWGTGPGSAALATARQAGTDGRATIAVADGDPAAVWVVVPLATAGARLWGAPTPASLFLGAGERAVIGGATADVCIRESGSGRVLHCGAVPGNSGDRASAAWDLFLGYDYDAPPWRVEIALPMATVLAPVHAFRRTFAATVIAVLGLVVLLSHIQVRRSLQPLDELRRGTQRLARRDFSGTVSVASRDEFEDLAGSFNDMAGELDRQFRTLTAVAAIDQAALTSVRGEQVAATAALQLLQTLQCTAVDVCVAGERADDPWLRVRAEEGAARTEASVAPTAAERQRLAAPGSTGFVCDAGDGFGWLCPPNGRPVVVVPLVGRDELLGLVAVRTGDGGPPVEEQLRKARQMGDKVAVGLSNARLIVRLDQLSYGALAALARTIDASSHWTAGHSERVTSLSLRMAHALALSGAQLDTLHRGGLLHDIGKIGIPPHILDKPGPLDVPETGRIREHPALGARILAPIAAFTDAIPIVRHHHEKFDGTGYPDGLRGEGIPYLARLLAVADVYDALVSSRPYRPGWSYEAALDTIRETSGSHFDPVMVETFLDVMAREGDGARFALSLVEAGT